MPLVATAPVVLESRTDSWLVAPAAGLRTTAWLRLPRSAGSIRLVTSRVGDQVAVRTREGLRTVYDGSCPSVGECQSVRALAGDGGDAFAIATAPDLQARFVMGVVPDRRLRILGADEGALAPGERDETRYATAGGGRAVWLDAGVIVARPLDASTPAEVVLRAGNTRGTVISLSSTADAVAFTARDEAGVYRVVVRPDGRPGRVIVEESRRGVTLGTVALAEDGTVVVARRSTGRRITDEIVAYRPDGPPEGEVVLTSASVPVGRVVDLVRPQIDGTLLAVRVRIGADGAEDAIFAVDLATGDVLRVAHERRPQARLSDPSVAGRRVAWARTRVAGGALVRSRVQAVRLRAVPPPPA